MDPRLATRCAPDAAAGGKLPAPEAAADSHLAPPGTPSGVKRRQAGRFSPLLASYVAFLVAVSVSMAAAATVASQDIPLMLGGF